MYTDPSVLWNKMYLYTTNIRDCFEYKVENNLWAINIKIIIYYLRIKVLLVTIPTIDVAVIYLVNSGGRSFPKSGIQKGLIVKM